MESPDDRTIRRADPRHAVSWPVRVNYGDDGFQSSLAYQGEIHNISNRGAYVRVPVDPRIGEHLHLELDLLPDGPGRVGLRLRCDAEVVRKEPPTDGSKNFGLGVRIVGYEPPQFIPGDNLI